MTLVFATNNAHKLEEARAILPNHRILSLADVGCHAEIPETQPTLEGNSLQKAQFVHDWLKHHENPLTKTVFGCFADDTGLEIDALGGAPGVYTARWCGDHCDPADNRKKALAELQGQTNRTAQFRTVVTCIPTWMPIAVPKVYEGVVRGAIATEERGNGGFGYDPVFIPEGYDRTFAELPAEVKNTISHRARALQKFALSLH